VRGKGKWLSMGEWRGSKGMRCRGKGVWSEEGEGGREDVGVAPH